MLAFKYLQALGFIDREKMEKGLIRRTSKKLPEELRNAILSRTQSSVEILEFLIGELADFQLSGDDGLKARTELMEYHYDA